MAVQVFNKVSYTILFSIVLLLSLSPSNTQACSLNPVAQIASPTVDEVHYTGEAVLFSGSGSVAMCGTITSYTWRVRNGGFGAWTQVSSSPTYWHTFTQAGTGWQVQLQVHNSVGRIHTRTITGIHVSNAPESQYYLTDHLGSVRAVVNRDGDLLSWSDYYPFGLPMPTRSGNTANAHDMIKFTGYEAEDEGDLGWYHAEARTYDPFIGRFNSVDPHAASYPGNSPYVYAANNPLIYIDPDGRDITIYYDCNDQGKECSEFVFTGDNSGEGRDRGNAFINQFLDAYEYVINSGGGTNMQEAATNRDLNIGLSHYNNRQRGRAINTIPTSSHYDRLNKIVYWIPLAGMETISGVVSPTTVLEHEITHAIEHALDSWGYGDRTQADTEGSAIRAETKTARALGEIGPNQVTRYHHGQGMTVATYGPTSNSVNRNMTYDYYLWLQNVANPARGYGRQLNRFRP
ncbi:MAG: hypothetical protein LAT68_17405 [Cyclobacteriaceae bacterium]|nr:hypothetical protein [Cyclobacteriaceae bacterium]